MYVVTCNRPCGATVSTIGQRTRPGPTGPNSTTAGWNGRSKTDKVHSKSTCSFLFTQIKALDAILATYTQEIDAMAARQEYRASVSALTCYKGIKNLFALTIITEIGDIKRLPHPRQLTAWVGMDIREYSSGGKQHRFGITREGNRYLRTAFIEANQRAYRSPIVSKDIKARRKGTDPQYIAIADRCLKRINKKGNRLLDMGKHPNKVKVACAREMIGFVWESLNQLAA